jgi:NCS1 family nucleobase:cation symporter-1
VTTENTVGAAADRGYGDRIVAVEPGSTEPVPDSERHGRPRQLFWTWTSPNLEFATIFVGVLSVTAFGQSVPAAVAAIVVGNLLAALAHGILSARGPAAGVPQMVLGRLAFGHRGNALPAALMTITSGFGWFAVNSVSAAFALSAITGGGTVAWLVAVVVVQVAVAFFGHNLVQAFERLAFPLLAVVLGAGAVLVLAASDPGAAASPDGVGGVGGFLLTVGAVVGYSAGWSPYAADYSRYLPRSVSARATGLAAGGGLFLSTTVLMTVGAASVGAATAAGLDSDNPTSELHRPAARVARRADPARHRGGRGRGERPQRVLRGDGVPRARHRRAAGAGAGRRRGGVRRGRLRHRAGRPRRRRGRVRGASCSSSCTGSGRGSGSCSPTSGCAATDPRSCSTTAPTATTRARSHSSPASSCRCCCSPTRRCSPGWCRRLLPGIGDVTFLVGMLLSAGLYALLVRRSMAR